MLSLVDDRQELRGLCNGTLSMRFLRIKVNTVPGVQREFPLPDHDLDRALNYIVEFLLESVTIIGSMILCL